MQETRIQSDWLATQFREFTSDAKRLLTLVQLTVNGISVLTEIPRIGEAIQKLEASRGIIVTDDEMNRAKEESELAKREVADGFPITYSQFLVDLWGLLEANIRKLVARWLENEPTGMQSKAVQRLKVRVGDYERHVGRSRFQLIVQLLEREEASSLKNGVDRFESLLSCIELDGPVPTSMKRTLYELSQLRNCIVHNARRADRQLIEACPWLGIPEESQIQLEYQQVHKYFRAVMDYSVLLMIRASNRSGEELGGSEPVFRGLAISSLRL